jgi:hypothetical protein
MQSLNSNEWFSNKLKWLLPLLLIPLVVFGSVVRYDDMVLSNSLKIGGTATANSKAAAEITSTTKGVLLPRLTTAQRDAIVAPPTSLIIFNTTANAYQFYDGATWSGMGGSGTITGPGASTDNAIALWNGVAGTVLKNSAVTVSGSAITGSLTGNASTATALAADPADCAANRFANAINASGTLTCGQVDVTTSAITGTLPIGSGGTGQTTKAAAFDALAPCTSGVGIITYGASTNSCKAAGVGNTGLPLVSNGSLSSPDFQVVGIVGGGTGAATLTNHGVLLGQGTSAIAATSVGATGTVLIGNTAADPTFSASPVGLTAVGINDSSAASSLYVKTSAIGVPSQTIKAIGGQTSDLFQVLDSSGVAQMIFSSGGNFSFFHNVTPTTTRFDIRGSTSQSSANSGNNARYNAFFGDPTALAANVGAGIALGGRNTASAGSETPYGYIWVNKDNLTAGDVAGSLHLATRNNSTGLVQRALELDSSGNASFWGTTASITNDAGLFKLISATDANASGQMKYNQASTRLELTASMASTSAGPSILINTDNVAGSNANATGGISLTTGNKTAGTGASGPITLTTGTSAGGTRGVVSLLDGSDGFDGMVWTSIGGTGAGHWQTPTGSNNFIAGNPDAELGVTSWSTYADAAATTPVDGTGGAPTITWTRTTSSPLAGNGSFLFTKDAANRQGNGASYPFQIRTSDQAKVYKIQFDYAVASGTFVAGSSSTDSDIEVYIYDVTNSLLIQPTTYKLYSSTTSPPAPFVAYFQTAIPSSSLRLILHTASTSASAYTVKFDNFTVMPVTPTDTAPLSETSFRVYKSAAQTGINTNNTSVQAVFDTKSFDTAGAYSTSLNRFIVPISGRYVFQAAFAFAGTNVLTSQYGVRFYKNGSLVDLTQDRNPLSGGAFNLAATSSIMDLVAGDYIEVFIYGAGNNSASTYGSNGGSNGHWFSGQRIGSSQSGGNDTVVAFTAYRGSSQTGVNPNNTKVKIAIDTITNDTHNAFSTANNNYVIPVAGYYVFTGCAAVGSTNVLASLYRMEIYKNAATLYDGTTYQVTASQAFNACITTPPILLAANDTIDLRILGTGNNSASTLTVVGSAGDTYLSGFKVASANSTSPTTTVAARYTNTAGTSITNSGADIVVPFATKDYDTHNAFVTDTYTVQFAGKYRVVCNIYFASSAYAASNGIVSSVYKNGSAVQYGPAVLIGGTPTGPLGAPATATLNLVAGDTIVCRTSNNRTAGATTLHTTAGTNSFEIERIGL